MMSTTGVASRLLRYTVKPKPGQNQSERVMFTAGQHCRPETAEREFAVVRKLHGTQGASRKSPASFELPEPHETATHVRATRPNGRRYWRIARDGETTTHLRREGEVVRQAEARHLIISFGLHEVNPQDPEQCARAFEYVRAEFADLFPGVQAAFTAQADGKGGENGTGKFHVHVVQNATLFADMDLRGKTYRAGSKLAQGLTDIDSLRHRADAFYDQHHHEFGLPPRTQPGLDERKRETRTSRDRRMEARGEVSNHDAIRVAFEQAMDDDTSDMASFITAMALRGVEVKHRSGSRGGSLSYWVDAMGTHNTGAKKFVRGATLGSHYGYESAMEQLSANAGGRPREKRPAAAQRPAARLVALATPAELEEARAEIARMAHEERLDRWVNEMADDEWFQLATFDSVPSRAELQELMAAWAQTKAETERALTPRPSPTGKGGELRTQPRKTSDWDRRVATELAALEILADAQTDALAARALSSLNSGGRRTDHTAPDSHISSASLPSFGKAPTRTQPEADEHCERESDVAVEPPTRRTPSSEKRANKRKTRYPELEDSEEGEEARPERELGRD